LNAKRKIFKNATASQNAVREVLSFVFAQELLSPSQDLFLVAPWISNVVIFNNHLGQFSSFNPEWGRREVRLTEVIVAVASSGTMIHVHTRPEPHNKNFEWRVKQAMSDSGVTDRLLWKEDALLHTKGLLTDRVCIDGSMNLTESGVALNDETISVSYDPTDISAARVHFETYEHG
jgi:phosphatidylserine/phosphatidylglycerophosphate/cardiolipin synthase-like enzyme